MNKDDRLIQCTYKEREIEAGGMGAAGSGIKFQGNPIKKVRKAEGQRLRDEIGVAEHLGPRRLRSSAGTNTQTLQCINLPDRGNPRISPRFSYGDIYHKRDELGRGGEHGDEIQNTDHLYEAVLIV